MMSDIQVVEIGTREQTESGNASLATTTLFPMLHCQGSARERIQGCLERLSLTKWGEKSQEAGNEAVG